MRKKNESENNYLFCKKIKNKKVKIDEIYVASCKFDLHTNHYVSR